MESSQIFENHDLSKLKFTPPPAIYKNSQLGHGREFTPLLRTVKKKQSQSPTRNKKENGPGDRDRGVLSYEEIDIDQSSDAGEVYDSRAGFERGIRKMGGLTERVENMPLRKQEMELERLQNENTKLKFALNFYQEKNGDGAVATKEVVETRELARRLKMELDKTRSELDRTKMAAAASAATAQKKSVDQDALEKARNEIEQRDEELRNSDSKIKELNDEMNDLRDDLDQAERQLDDRDEEIEHLKSQLKRLENKSMSVSDHDNEDPNSVVEAQNETIEELQSQINKLRDKLDTTEIQLSQERKQLLVAQDDLDAELELNSSLDDKYIALKKEYSQLQVRHSSELENLRKKVSNAEHDRDAIEIEMAVVRQKLKETQLALEASEREISSMENEARRTRSSLQSVREENERLRDEVRVSGYAVTDVDRLKHELDARGDAAEQQVIELKQRLRDMELEAESEHRRAQIQEKDLEELQLELANVDAELAKSRLEIDRLRLLVESEEATYRATRDETVKTKEREIEKLRLVLVDRDEHIEELERLNSDLKLDVKTKQDQLNKSDLEAVELNNKIEELERARRTENLGKVERDRVIDEELILTRKELRQEQQQVVRLKNELRVAEEEKQHAKRTLEQVKQDQQTLRQTINLKDRVIGKLKERVENSTVSGVGMAAASRSTTAGINGLSARDSGGFGKEDGLQQEKKQKQEQKHLVQQAIQIVTLRHEQQLQAVGEHLKYLKLKLARESQVRDDLVFMKRFFILKISNYQACNRADLRLFEEMGIYPDYSIIGGQRRTLRGVVCVVVAALRMKKRARAYRIQQAMKTRHYKHSRS